MEKPPVVSNDFGFRPVHPPEWNEGAADELMRGEAPPVYILR
ncbi:hypothetical protein [Paenibacillus sp. y28]